MEAAALTDAGLIDPQRQERLTFGVVPLRLTGDHDLERISEGDLGPLLVVAPMGLGGLPAEQPTP